MEKHIGKADSFPDGCLRLPYDYTMDGTAAGLGTQNDAKRPSAAQKPLPLNGRHVRDNPGMLQGTPPYRLKKTHDWRILGKSDLVRSRDKDF
ncbi:hypothetical protein [Paraburkholderia lycopersici]|uniref:hypothetical protein n=1 Tax=Paraburkholderia lycopersici TaxID=416944 RepID=UPI001160F37F|nr:hypothetical protein [Paraburkholderia lycopersici]